MHYINSHFTFYFHSESAANERLELVLAVVVYSKFQIHLEMATPDIVPLTASRPQ